MAPVVKELEKTPKLQSFVCVTGQHREMLRQALDVFAITPDHDLNVMEDAQELAYITSAVLQGVDRVLDEVAPDAVLVHGDTTTTLAASLAAFYRRIPVGHVEAGLRTGDMYSPWPEEMNRCVADRIASLHFAPTEAARANLLSEAVSADNIVVTGNTVIDALFWVRDVALRGPGVAARIERAFSFLDPTRKLILVTGHRRENFDGGLENVCRALRTLAERDDVQIVYPVHPNPNVRAATGRVMHDVANVHLIEPLDYLSFAWLMDASYLVITDSGGIQEEAPSLGKPVLVARDTTERPEAIAAGTVRLVGTDAADIVDAAATLLDDAGAYEAMARAVNPYGDGRASGRIVRAIEGRWHAPRVSGPSQRAQEAATGA